MATVVLSLGSASLAVGTDTRGERSWEERQPVPTADDLGPTLDSVLARRDLPARRGVMVLLEPPLVQTRTLTDLPPVPGKELNALVGSQLRRFFRVNGRPMVSAAAWNPSGSGERTARAAAADHALISTIEAATRRASVPLLGIAPATGDAVDQRLILATPEGRQAKFRSAARRSLAPLGIALLCWAGTGAAYIVDLRLDERRVALELADLSGPLAQIEGIRAKLDEFTPMAVALRAQGVEGAWATDALARVAEALPDSCHVVVIEARKGGDIRLEVRAADPAAVLEALSSASFRTPALVSAPVAEEAAAGRIWSRFVITTGDPK